MARMGDTYNIEVKTEVIGYDHGDYSVTNKAKCPVCGEELFIYEDSLRSEWKGSLFSCHGCKNEFKVVGPSGADYEDDFVEVKIAGISFISEAVARTALALLAKQTAKGCADNLNKFKADAYIFPCEGRSYRAELTIREVL